MNILIAEDEAINRLYIASLLKRRQYEYTEVATGPAALTEALSGKYDLMLLDLGLPGLDGIDLVKTLRSQNSNLKVLAVTGRDFSEGGDFLTAEGFNGLVAKPIQEFVFYQEIDRILQT